MKPNAVPQAEHTRNIKYNYDKESEQTATGNLNKARQWNESLEINIKTNSPPGLKSAGRLETSLYGPI